MIRVHYKKRKNQELFKKMQMKDSLFLSKAQNYLPIYTRFFQLNETNCNHVHLNHGWFLSDVLERTFEDGDSNVFVCKVQRTDPLVTKVRHAGNQDVKEVDVFFKFAPLLDPYKYLIGKYDLADPHLMALPQLHSTPENCHPKLLDCNNAAYVDGMFVYLSSMMQQRHQFVHGVDYYGSCLAIKHDFKLNVFDDIDYLATSDFFNKHKGSLFQVEDYDHLIQTTFRKLKPIKIGQQVSLKSVQSMDAGMFEDVFEEERREKLLDEEKELEEVEMEKLAPLTLDALGSSLKSGSSCSSRSSHTHMDESEDCDFCDGAKFNDDSKFNDDAREEGLDSPREEEDNDDSTQWTDEGEDESFCDEEEKIHVTIPQFPVQVIGMEHCESTLEDLLMENEVFPVEEWMSALMQIVMTLLAYQKAFQFTHNDLHASNVMYVKTPKKYLYYCYNKKHYKVPTFGRIFKIIDFGRSIYKFDGKVFCSDSFQLGGDAASQYNTEPYFNDKKPRLEPNPSFDLCRLACSLFQFALDDIADQDEYNALRTNPKNIFQKLIFDWCMDDCGNNILYKNDGSERYPDFKLYKMIARCVHFHTPEAQLERPEFDAFRCADIPAKESVMNLDAIPSMVGVAP